MSNSSIPLYLLSVILAILAIDLLREIRGLIINNKKIHLSKTRDEKNLLVEEGIRSSSRLNIKIFMTIFISLLSFFIITALSLQLKLSYLGHKRIYLGHCMEFFLIVATSSAKAILSKSPAYSYLRSDRLRNSNLEYDNWPSTPPRGILKIYSSRWIDQNNFYIDLIDNNKKIFPIIFDDFGEVLYYGHGDFDSPPTIKKFSKLEYVVISSILEDYKNNKNNQIPINILDSLYRRSKNLTLQSTGTVQS